MRTALAPRDAPLMDPAAAITTVTFPPVGAFAWLLTPFIFGALVACSHRLRTAVARHLRLCLTAGRGPRAATVPVMSRRRMTKDIRRSGTGSASSASWPTTMRLEVSPRALDEEDDAGPQDRER